jgi:radical SAM protein with 4Fe4S-binding SPASM domain
MGNFFCAAPWRGLHINPRGDVKTCCAGDPNMLGNLNSSSITEILSNKKLREIREVIKSGNLHPEYCKNCVKTEKYGSGERSWHNSVNQDFDISSASLDEFDPTIIDVRWNTTCNLSCNYCDSSASSKWASLTTGISINNVTRTYYDDVCDWLAANATNIKEVALVGGEPLLLPENEKLLDVIPSDCIVTVITNATADLEKNRIFQKLKKRQRVGWSISFDNIEQRFEYVRHGANWDQLIRNLDQLQHLMATQGHWGGIHAVYNIYNASRLREFHKFARSRGLSIHWQTLYQPECLDPSRLGADVMALVRSEIKILLNSNICLPEEHAFFENVLHAQDNNTDQRSDLAKHIHDIENRYHKNQQGQFARLWPELEKLCR